MPPKEDQQPMTTREELVANYRSDWIKQIQDVTDVETAECIVELAELNGLFDPVNRLASRQEVSVTVEELATLIIDCWKSGKAPRQVARALIAKYFMTKRTTEG